MNLLHGDCLEVLKTLDENSVDSVVTDPPYGLSFMGKKWDYDVPSAEVWREVLRVLKPGGHLLAFAGTRTYHRMTVNIEDAGFEIRDQIMWLYGSGFPKSLNISKALDKMAGAEREVVGKKGGRYSTPINKFKSNEIVGQGTNGAFDGSEVTAPATEAAKQWEGWGTALKPAFEPVCVATKPLNGADLLLSLARDLSLKIGAILCQSPSFANAVKKNLASSQSEYAEELNTAQWLAGKSTLTPGASFALMGMSLSDSEIPSSLSIACSWLNTLAEILEAANTCTTEMESSLIIDLKTLNSFPWKSMHESITQEGMKALGKIANALSVAPYFDAVNTKLRIIQTPSAIESVTSWGDQRALRPDASPICVARKPISEKNIAENVLKWGVGGINVDGCRIGMMTATEIARSGKSTTGMFAKGGLDWSRSGKSPQGRFPASLILGHSDNCTEDACCMFTCAVALLDRQSGLSDARGGKPKQKSNSPGQIAFAATGGEKVVRNDAGGASRFFYVAKVSSRERNAGLEGMPDKILAYSGGAAAAAARGEHYNNGDSGMNQTKIAKNNHPTVKPIKLMEYLCRLVTPPGGVVLDPFMGSGSTGIAAKNLGFGFIGIEREEEYHAIAKARIGV